MVYMFSPEKLFEIMKEKGFNNQRLSNALSDIGIPIKPDAFKAYKYNRASPRMEVFSGIVDILDITEQELFEITPRKEKLLSTKYGSIDIERSSINIKNATTNFSKAELDKSVVSIPVFIQGTFLKDIKSLVSDKNLYIEMDLLKNYYNYRNIIAINVSGDSMGRRNTENNIFLIELVQHKEFSKAEGLYLVRYGNIVQIKRVQFLGNGEVLLISLNTAYQPINPKREVGDDWEIIGKPFMKMNIEYYNNVEYLE